MHTIQDYRNLQLASAELGAAEYLKTGKLSGVFQEAVEYAYNNEAMADLLALLLTYAPLGDIRMKMEEHAFGDDRMERGIGRIEEIQYESRADARRYKMGA